MSLPWSAPGATLQLAFAGSIAFARVAAFLFHPRGAFVLDSDSNGPKLGRAAVTFGGGDPAFSDAQTLNVGGSIGELDLAGWLDLLTPSAGSGTARRPTRVGSGDPVGRRRASRPCRSAPA